MRPSLSTAGWMKPSAPTAAAGIYDARHPVGSRKHITFMEVGALIRRLFRDLWARPTAAGSKTQPSVTTSIRCLTADRKEADAFISRAAYLPKYTQRLNNTQRRWLIIKHWFIPTAELRCSL